MDSTLVQLRLSEWLGLLAVLGAVLTLGVEIGSGVNVWTSGLSGIDEFVCRAQRS